MNVALSSVKRYAIAASSVSFFRTWQYNRSMKNRSIGVGIIAAGVILLLANIGLFNMSEIVRVWWPVVLVIVAMYLLVDDVRNNSVWAALFALFGLFLLLRNLEIITIDFGDIFWPTILIAVGVSILVGRYSTRPKTTNKPEQEVTAFLAGVDHQNRSKEYQGSKVTAVLGGATLDISKATIKKEATITLFALMGGIEIRVPENVIIKTSTMCILGGIEDKYAPEEKANSPVLYIEGTVIMGGVEIKR